MLWPYLLETSSTGKPISVQASILGTMVNEALERRRAATGTVGHYEGAGEGSVREIISNLSP